MPRLRPLLDAHPDLQVQLVRLPRTFSWPSAEADLAIAIESRRMAGSMWSSSPITRWASTPPPIICAVIRRCGSARRLARHRVITYVRDLLFTPRSTISGKLGVPAGPRFECASVIGQFEAVRAGIGIGLLHVYAAEGAADLVRLLPALAVSRTYWLTTIPMCAIRPRAPRA